MKTPIIDYIQQYKGSGISRLHMPGHKGHPYLGPESMDITEIKGADELYFPDGIIEESEHNASQLFGSRFTCYSTEGSSHCIRSMMILIAQHARKNNRKTILAARNAHKAFLYACAICDLDVRWIYPSIDAENSIAACQITASSVRDALSTMAEQNILPAAVYLTTPDYLGQQAELPEISEICHQYDCLLAVDNAHGAYLHFLSTPAHPMDLGADICCDSAHKTLPVLTGGAYLHVGTSVFTKTDAKNAMEITGTTSPSYLIMASLDLCNRYLEQATTALTDTITMVRQWKEKLKDAGIPILFSEELKIVIHASAMGYTGMELGEHLRQYMAEPEFCDHDYLVCMITPDTMPEDLTRLYEAMVHTEKRSPISSIPVQAIRSEQVLSIRDGVFGIHELIPVEDAAGRICGAPSVSCPPAVPIVISGEIITNEAIEIMKAYEIDKVSVMS